MAQPAKIIMFPPCRVHGTKPLTAAEAQPLLATYLAKSTKKPCLHPDAWLRAEGVRHGFKGGPSGGFVMHHLRRIEAGLRGESLQPETTQELVLKFGEDAVVEATGMSLGDVQAAVGNEDEIDKSLGDDTRVDKVIKEGDNERAKRRKEKKERREREKAAKAAGASLPISPPKKRKRAEEQEEAEDSEARSGANTPYADSMVAFSESKWTSKEEYEQSQSILEGEVGERGGAPVVRQDGKPPVVVEHDGDGNVIIPPKKRDKPLSQAQKLNRKEAKKMRRRQNLDQ
ncbi:Hypothetical predicted protein [Lecanosticta acicola]|uniref:Uncharacterized protein n=1 Tax=Lecanosticta acicola TaxID=111012 RepID=A0AAI8YT98_9PEZI|nr:Hypothetical predicted protein [Lecanosticta acicola]